MKSTELQLIQKAFDQIPKINCKGLCEDSCGPIHISRLEMRYIEEYCRKNDMKIQVLRTASRSLIKIIDDLKTGNCKMCPYLKDKRCTIYEVRPAICRIWGVVTDMPCPHGCEIEGDILSTKESFNILGMFE